MTIRRRLITGMGLCCALAAPAQAQDQQRTTINDPLSTEKAPNTTAVGQTKPPSRDASPTSTKAIDKPTSRQVVDDAITSKVCTGCRRDPATTGTLSTPPAPKVAEEKRDVKLDELHALAPPQKQSDLNTVELASAHREQAKSMEEKTDGLWQSWLVSVCEGCGDQKPARAMRFEEWPARDAALKPGSDQKKTATAKPHPAGDVKAVAQRHGAIEADLSSDNLESIRRMPER